MTEENTNQKSVVTPEQRHTFCLEAYRAALESKHHYDQLSWVIGGVAVIFFGAILAYLPRIHASTYFLTLVLRFGPAILAWLLLFVWHSIYERNRFWAEVANETARDLERTYCVRGVTIAFAEAHLSGKLLHKNIDQCGIKLAEPREEQCKQKSFHTRVSLMFWIATTILAVVWLIPGGTG